MSTEGAPNADTEGNVPYVSVWDGGEMLLWADSGPGDSGAYNPATDRWGPIATAGAPGPDVFYQDTAVWTGDEMIVWGNVRVPPPPGVTPGPGAPPPTYLAAGGSYNPATGRWRPMSENGAPTIDPTMPYPTVWTGAEMIVWGVGYGTGSPTGAAYNPATDSWRTISIEGAPSLRSEGVTAWTGSEMLAWGEAAGSPAGRAAGAAYDPLADVWTPLSAASTAVPGRAATAVWLGHDMFVYWGVPGAGLQDGSRAASGVGALYDPSANAWWPVSPLGVPAASPLGYARRPAVWTGQEVLLWNLNALYVYDPVVDTWSEASTAGEPSPRDENVPMVWTGNEALIWGGEFSGTSADNYHGKQYPGNGAAYTPCTGQAGTAPGVGAEPLSGGAPPPSK